MDGGFGAPLGGEATDSLVDIVVKAEEVADDATVKERTVGVGVCEVGGEEVLVSELVKDLFCPGELGVGEGAEVEGTGSSS